MFRQEEVVEGAMAGEAEAGADQLDLEAAEQLIQLSGGDGGSESRSADSVKCCGADRAGAKEKDKEVESRRRRTIGRFAAGKDGDGGEPDRKSVNSVNRCSNSMAAGTEDQRNKEEPAVESRKRSAGARFLARKDAAGVVDDAPEERRRPRFRWLADIYRETRQVTAPDPRAAGGNVPPEGEATRKRKRAADDAGKGMVVPVVAKESKERTAVA